MISWRKIHAAMTSMLGQLSKVSNGYLILDMLGLAIACSSYEQPPNCLPPTLLDENVWKAIAEAYICPVFMSNLHLFFFQFNHRSTPR